jgi:hypothetical protein
MAFLHREGHFEVVALRGIEPPRRGFDVWVGIFICKPKGI